MKQKRILIFIGVVVFLFAKTTFAGSGNIPSTFGILPAEMGSAQTEALFGSGISAAYYNPAGLASDGENHLTLSYVHARPALQIESDAFLAYALNSNPGDAQPRYRAGIDTKTDQNNTALVGFKFSLSDAFEGDRQISFGLAMGIEERGKSLLTVTDQTNETGQYMRYGKKPLFLSAGLGFEIFDGFTLGAGALVTVGAKAPVELRTTLNGITSREKIVVQGDTKTSPLASVMFRPGDFFCPAPPPRKLREQEREVEKDKGDKDGDKKDDKKSASKNEKNAPDEAGAGEEVTRGPRCFSDRFAFTMFYRGESYFSLDLNAKAQVFLQGSQLTSVPLVVGAVDAYVPTQYGFGIKYTTPSQFSISLAVEYQKWSGLTALYQELSDVSDGGNLQFSDTVVPRLSFEYAGWGDAVFRLGYSYEKSPLQGVWYPGVNLLDSDRHIVGAGIGYTFKKPFLMTKPLTIEVGFQRHILKSRSFYISKGEQSGLTPDPRLISLPDLPVKPYESITAGGFVNAASVSVTMRF